MAANTTYSPAGAGAGGKTCEYRGAHVPAYFEDAATEYFALRRSCGIAAFAWRGKLVLTGADRVRWLNGMVTNNVRDLPAGFGVYAFLLNAQGRILGDLYAFNRGDYLLIETDSAQLAPLTALF